MKRRVISVVLSAAMALSLTVPTMAVETTEKTTGTVLVKNVPGGVVCAEVNGEYLPIGEPVELKAGIMVDASTQPLFYYDAEDDVYVESGTKGIYVATSSDAKPEMLGENYYGGSFEVKAGEDYTVTAEFVQHLDQTQDEDSKDPWLSLQLDRNWYSGPDETAGVKPVVILNYVQWNETEQRYYGTRLNNTDVTSVELTRVRYDDGKSSQLLGQDVISYKDGMLTWSDKLALGDYQLRFEILYKGVTYTTTQYITVGQRVGLYLPLGYYLWSQTDEYTEYEPVTARGYGSQYMAITDKMTVNDVVKVLDPENEASKQGIYGYKFAGWSVFDYSTGKFTVLKGDEKLVELTSYNLYARYMNGDKEYKPVEMKRLDEVLQPETVPDTDEKLESAVEKLDDLVPEDPAAATPAEKEAFNEAVEQILTGMKKVSTDVQMKIAISLGTKLKGILGLTIDSKDGITVDDSVFVAAGLTFYEDKGAKVTLELVGSVATSNDATKPGEFTVKMSVEDANGNKKPVKELEVPIEVTVTLPADLVASMSNAGKTYVLKIGNKEIPFELNEEDNTITFTTDTLGAFTICEATKKPSASGSTSGGSYGNYLTNHNASGTWIQEADGRWWFKYTSGGYPAGKWEMIKSKWYYFNADGYMATGWQLINNVWYHLDEVNGDMTIGWYQDPADGKWYYLDASGAMLVGWQMIGGVYYYLSDAAAAPTYTYDAATEKWVYSARGMRPYGSMYANEVTPDGYTVDANGAWVQ